MNKKRILEVYVVCLMVSLALLFTGALFELKYLAIGAGWVAFGGFILFAVMWVSTLIIEKDNKPKEVFEEKPEKKYTLVDITNGNHRIMGHSMTGTDIFTFIHNSNFDSISDDFETPEKTIINCYVDDELTAQYMVLKEEEGLI